MGDVLAFEILNGVGEPLRGGFDTRGVKASTCATTPEAVVLCHGFRSSRKSSTLVAISRKLSLPTVMFDFSGNGESGGQFQYGNYAKEVEDLRSVILWTRDQGFRVKGVLGHSKGGNVVLLYGAKYDDVDRIVSLSARYDLRKGVEERIGQDGLRKLETDGVVQLDGYAVTKEGLAERLSTDMDTVAEIKKSAVMLCHGDKDDVADATESVELSKLVEKSELAVISGADHRFSQHTTELVEAVVPFLEG